MNENDKRLDKFYPIKPDIFRECVAFALRNGDRKIAYCKRKNESIYGGMADSFEEALEWCRKFYEEDNNCDLSIADYSGATVIYQTNDILHEIKVISDEEYDKYINNINLED